MSIRLHINELEVSAEPGEFLLNVARRAGFDIPALCAHEAVPPIGACRVCLVEVTQNGRSQISTSCNLPVEQGLKVRTDTPLVRQHRAMNLELLLARAPGSAVLRSLASQAGVQAQRLHPREDSGIANCILCELCVRTCAQLGHHALNVIGRGHKKRIGLPFHQPSPACVGCGSCASVCPTRCILQKDTATGRTIWGRTFSFVLCKHCRAPLLTQEQLAHVLATKKLPEGTSDVCESCKQTATAQRFAQVVWG